MTAKFKPNKIFEQIVNSFGHAVFKGLTRKGCSAQFTKNQHALLLTKKSKPTIRRTQKQEICRNRFMQCECMFKTMTDPQYILFEWREEYYPDDDFYNLRTRDMFMSLCLKRKLYKFLEYTLELEVKLSIVKETDDEITLKVEFTEQDPRKHGKRWMYVEGDWFHVTLDRFHLRYGDVVIYGSTTEKIDEKLAYTQATANKEAYFTLSKSKLVSIFGNKKVIIHAEHEKVFSNTITIDLTEEQPPPPPPPPPK